MSIGGEGVRRVCIAALVVVNLALVPVLLYTGVLVWAVMELFGDSQINTPRAAGLTVGSVSVVSQALTLLIVVRSGMPTVLRVGVGVVDVVVIGLYCLVMADEVERWWQWGTASTFWSGETSDFHGSLVVSVLAPVVCYLIALGTRRRQKLDGGVRVSAERSGVGGSAGEA